MKISIETLIFESRFSHLCAVVDHLGLDMETVTEWKDRLFPTALDEEFSIYLRTIILSLKKEYHPTSSIAYDILVNSLNQHTDIFGLRIQYFIGKYFKPYGKTQE